ncbi:FAD-dependent oxidoreductase [Streptomyces sp. NPDC058434]|uniref:prenylcysteine lyase family protein n=1 Tax=Streptomyces sp. NPDC058434 TaxID=3346498 RepID=UPI003659C2A3
MRIGVIGAGICGAAVAERLRRALGGRCRLFVLDCDSRVGGRVRSFRFAGQIVEAGASLFHSSNVLVRDYVEHMGLQATPASPPGHTAGIWDGEDFLYRTRGRSWRDTVAMTLRYRGGLYRLSKEAKDVVDRMGDIYPMLVGGVAWPSPWHLLQSVGLADLARVRAVGYLAGHRCRCGTRLLHEFVNPVSRNCYGQVAAGMNALAEAVSLVGGGLAGGQLLRVREGNDVLCRGLLTRANAEVRLSTTVRRAVQREEGWELYLADSHVLPVDAVVLAAPPELTGIQWEPDPFTRQSRTYKRIHVTFLHGDLKPDYFGVRETPGIVLTTDGHRPFLSLERIGPSGIYKIFSEASLPDELVRSMFGKVHDSREVIHDAYPFLFPREKHRLFSPLPGLYDATAMEDCVSTMETQMIAGQATANLLIAHVS